MRGERMRRYAIAPVVDLVLNPLPAPPQVQRLLVIRLGAMGDVVRTLPAVALLRDHYPTARIDWLVEERTAEVVEGRAYVDRVVVFPRAALVERIRGLRGPGALGLSARFVRELRARAYDLVLDFHSIARSGVLAQLTRAALRVGYAPPHAREGAHRFVDHPVRLAQAKVSRFERNEALVRAVIGEPCEAATAPLIPAAAAQAAVAHRLGGGSPPVVLHPGSSRAAAHKRWPPTRYGELARRLASEGHRPLIAAGPAVQEQALAEAARDASGGAAELAPATQTFEELAALLAASAGFVGSDSGPLHVASLVGTPVVQLLGPTDPRENEPWAATAWRRVEVPLACRPCRRGCAAAACMRAIDVAAVAAAFRSLSTRGASLRMVPPAGA